MDSEPRRVIDGRLSASSVPSGIHGQWIATNAIPYQVRRFPSFSGRGIRTRGETICRRVMHECHGGDRYGLEAAQAFHI